MEAPPSRAADNGPTHLNCILKSNVKKGVQYIAHRRRESAPGTKQALQTGLADFIDQTDELSSELAVGEQGIPVAILALGDLPNGVSVGTTHEAGWGFFAGTAAGPAIAAHIAQSEPAEEMTGFSRGPEIAALIRALHEVETLPHVQANDYELWILRIPALLMESFWLKSQSGEPDLVVPFHTLSKQLEAMHAYTAAEFVQLAQPLIAGFQVFDKIYDAPAADKSTA